MIDRGSRSGLLAAWALPLLLFVAVFSVYSMTSERHAVNTDAYAASVGAWRLASEGSPWLDDVEVDRLPGTHGVSSQGTWLGQAPNGHVVAQRMAGPILAGVPFYFVLDRSPSPDDFSIAPGGVAASALSAGAVLLLFLALRAKSSVWVALVVALTLAFATPTWSVSANGLWTHPVTQLGIAGSAFALSRERWSIAGVSLAVGMLGRPHIALIAAVVGLGTALSRRQIKPVVGLALPGLAALGFLATWNRLVFGVWSIGGEAYGRASGAAISGYRGTVEHVGGSQWTNYLGFFVSGDRGLLTWTPLILILLPALVRSWRSLPDWTRLLCIGGILYEVAQLRINHFSGGEGFYGYRHGLELLTCLTPAFGMSLTRLGKVAKVAAPMALAAQFAAITIGAVSEGFFVPVGRVWTDNSFWLALRNQPTVVGPWLGLCLAAGAVGAAMLMRRPAELSQADPRVAEGSSESMIGNAFAPDSSAER